ncbi:MAG: SO_0444 family Cu/Zn efflux transporter [Elusimicrobia bacterium]|nr:SO_0444 family Cu/Zn efflux transporter [Elusimicrobiota bacterium]
MNVLIGLSTEIWRTFCEASFYIIGGIFIAGLIHIFLDEAVIARRLGRSNFRSVLWAALLGAPLPLCSCGVIPAAVSLRKKGASKGAVLSFLISTPESGIDSFLLSLALLDPILAFSRPIAAFITAVIAGAAENRFGHPDKNGGPDHGHGACCPSCAGEAAPEKPAAGFKAKFFDGMRYGFVEMLGDIGKWLIFGIVLAGVISYAFPQSFIERYLGSGWLSMVLMLIIGIPMYICASASTPIAAALLMKGLSPGAALVFLLAGPATNAAGLSVLSRIMGKRTVFIYLAAISVSALVLGGILNAVYAASGINATASIGHVAELLPDPLKTLSAFALIVLTANAINPVRGELSSGCRRKSPTASNGVKKTGKECHDEHSDPGGHDHAEH